MNTVDTVYMSHPPFMYVQVIIWAGQVGPSTSIKNESTLKLGTFEVGDSHGLVMGNKAVNSFNFKQQTVQKCIIKKPVAADGNNSFIKPTS